MPPRFLTLAILALWLAMAGLFLYGDVWPRLAESEPLLFPVDVVDEAGQQKELVNYSVSKNQGRPDTYKAEVEWRYHPEDDGFESNCELGQRWSDPEPPRAEGPAWLPQVHQFKMTSSYFLARNGQMKSIEAKTEYRLVVGKTDQEGIDVKAEVTGSPRDRQFAPHLRFSFPKLKDGTVLGPLTLRDFERDGDTVAVSERGTVLNPLHPPRRFPELSAGQHWRVTVIDPLVLPGKDPARAWVLEARVLPEPEKIEWQDGNIVLSVSCRVVRCSGDGPVGPLTFWVREADGAVMRQEVTVGGDLWSFVRLSQAYKMRSPPRERTTP